MLGSRSLRLPREADRDEGPARGADALAPVRPDSVRPLGPRQRERAKILLVDDQPSKLLTYEAMLRDLDETLVKAGSARQALEVLLRNDIALILIDVCMPELDGLELATLIRHHPRYKMIPIIFVSAVQVTDFDRLRGYEAGAVDYVPVPVVAEVLRAKISVFVELHLKTRELERINAHLEDRVAERTAALQKLNAELEERVETRTRERESALAQLFESQKMETIGRLTGGVAHDFNNLLMAVTGSLEMLKKRLPDDARMHRLVETAMQGADRGAALTQRLLAFSRRQELQPDAVDVGRLIRDMVGLLERAVGPGVRIARHVPDGLPPARVDGHQLELAILNLAVNARDAMPDGGTLVIDGGRQIECGKGTLPRGEYVRISVKDTGAGMSPTTVAKASEPFFTTKDVGKGTGLGLSMVHGLAAQSGGEIRIASEVGRGTSIDILLPVAAAPDEIADAPPTQPASAAPDRACTVLLVDDDPLVIAGTRALLEDLGHRVIAAASATEALNLLFEGPLPDLVLTDHAMPETTGLVLARRIAHAFPRLPVVIATGYADLPELQAADFRKIEKPFRQDALAEIVAGAVRVEA